MARDVTPDKAGTFTWRRGDGGQLEVLLVTSRKTGDWIAPLGSVEAGETHADAAGRETREEAGIEVTVGDLVGDLTWRDAKDRERTCRFFAATWRADVDWLEEGQRERAWLSLIDAMDRVLTQFRPLLRKSAGMVDV